MGEEMWEDWKTGAKGKIFLKDVDGNLVEFNGLQEIEITESNIDQEEDRIYSGIRFHPWYEPITINLDMRKKQSRRFLKALSAAFHSEMRRRRHAIRMKEKERRKRLKGKI